MGKIRLEEQATPATPPTGFSDIFVDSADKHLKQIDDTGLIHEHGHGSQMLNIVFNTDSNSYEVMGSVVWPGSDDIGIPNKISANVFVGDTDDRGDLKIFDATNALTIAEFIDVASIDLANLIDLGTLSNISEGEAVWEIQGRETADNKNAQFDIRSMTIFL